MKGFIEWLEKLNEKDSKVRAVLRRSLAFDPGLYIPAYPYVEPFIQYEDKHWRRKVFYLVSGVWAMHWRQGRSGAQLSIGEACAVHLKSTGSTSTERRFIILLDSDSEQLPHRLRQMISLLNKQSIDFADLLNGLIFWEDDQKKTQNAWAREFYRNI